MRMGRRQFLGASASAVVAAGTLARGQVFGANDRIRVGVPVQAVHRCNLDEEPQEEIALDADGNIPAHVPAGGLLTVRLALG